MLFRSVGLDKQLAKLDAAYQGKVKGILCNVVDEENVQAMIAEAASFFNGPFDILINCAGKGQSGLFSATPDSPEITKRTNFKVESNERWADIFSINFYGPLYGCRHVLPIMIQQGSGQIVNIISGLAYLGLPYSDIYASSKAALNALTLALRYEYWDSGIKINAATPGVVATPIFEKSGGKMPTNAQSPEMAAKRILVGVSQNERLIHGDNEDIFLAAYWGAPKYATTMDRYMADVVEVIIK